MKDKLKKFLGFPYSKELEDGYNKDLMKSLHKPLMIALTATLLLLAWLISVCIFTPDFLAPPEYIDGILLIHLSFLIYTLIILMIAVSMRRQLYQYPKMHVFLCNIYGIGICLWATVLSAYSVFSPAVYTAFVFVMLCAAMVALFKPWLALVSYTGNYIVYVILSFYLHAPLSKSYIALLFNASLATIIGIIIAVAFYRYRTRVYYDKQIISKQMTRIKQINGQLQRLIHIDTLTGLFNRRFYDEILPVEIKNLTEKGYCAMMFDIDFFKLYNDSYGHPAGDECLRIVSSIIKECLPKENSFAVRYGGEEFFVVVTVDSKKEASKLGESIIKTVENAYIPHMSSPFNKVTLSCGLMTCDKGKSPGLQEITDQADKALYCSKQNGRNQVTVFQNDDLKLNR